MKKEIKQIPNWSDKAKYLFNKPGWLPEYLGGQREVKDVEESYKKFDTNVPKPLNFYVFFQYVVLMGLTAYFLFNLDSFDWVMKVALSALIIWSTVSFSGIFEQSCWYHVQEIVRVALFSVAAWYISLNFLPENIIITALFLYAFTSYFWLWKNESVVKNFQKSINNEKLHA
jgi:hypothetical protein